MDRHPSPAAPAGLGRRLASLSYEIVLLVAVLFVSGWAFLFLSRGLDGALARPLFQLFLLAVTGAYYVYCWTHGGQTLPMKTWRLRLATRDGTAILPGTAVRRFLFAVIGIGLCGLGLVWALFDREGQFLHDRLAGTRIVRIGD